jgi:hypothetical protein
MTLSGGLEKSGKLGFPSNAVQQRDRPQNRDSKKSSARPPFSTAVTRRVFAEGGVTLSYFIKHFPVGKLIVPFKFSQESSPSLDLLIQ